MRPRSALLPPRLPSDPRRPLPRHSLLGRPVPSPSQQCLRARSLLRPAPSLRAQLPLAKKRRPRHLPDLPPRRRSGRLAPRIRRRPSRPLQNRAPRLRPLPHLLRPSLRRRRRHPRPRLPRFRKHLPSGALRRQKAPPLARKSSGPAPRSPPSRSSHLRLPPLPRRVRPRRLRRRPPRPGGAPRSRGSDSVPPPEGS